ncbi:MAG: TonB-dependent receptor [Proteobacteria bacterium]|nr:TonB-dependent receptor [Pseudomonadota bacterium]
MPSQDARCRQSHFRPVLAVSTLVCGCSGLIATALAQTQTQAQKPDDSLQEVVVTGSRLIRTDLTAPSPTTVVSAEDIKLSGNVTLDKTLNEFPQLATGNASSVNNGGGSGILTANLRGLSTNNQAVRTLTLVNGRRFIPADQYGNVDLASIPDALIKRVDIITGGASAVYGSDAIAGAVNFVLDDHFSGLQATAQYGINSHGDGSQRKYDITFGSNMDGNKGNVVGSFSYTQENSFTQADRDFSAIPLADNSKHTGFVYSGSGNIPGTRVPLSATQLAGLEDLVPTTDPSCTSVTGVRFLAGGAATPYCQPEDTYNYAGFNLLQRPLERVNVTFLAHYDIVDHVTAFGEAYFVDSKNNYVLAPDSFTPVTPGAPSSTLLVPNYAGNPILSAATRQFLVDNANVFDPKGTGTASIVGGGRRADELGPREAFFQRISYNVTGGLRGDFDLIGQNWKWEVFGQYMYNRTNTSNINFVNQTRLSLALDAVTNSAGQVVCRVQISGCAPTSLFGSGSISAAAAQFMTPERDSHDEFFRHVAGGSVSGTLFNLPAGPVALALGTEYRKDTYTNDVSPFDLAGEYGAASNAALSGGFSVKEAFMETRLPILSDLPFVKTLAVEAAARYSDYTTVGNVFTWKAGGEYAPVEWLRFRGAFNRAVRAPNVGELYSAQTQGFTGGTDPCSVTAGSRSDALKALCVAQGVPASDINTFTQATLGLTQQSGGNPNLQAEKSNTYTIGAVISPPWVQHFNLTVDYFKVNVHGAITSINAQQTLNDCYTNLIPDSPTCLAVHRLPSNGQIDFVNTALANIGFLQVSGVDTQADYKLALPSLLELGGHAANLSLQATASWLFNRTTQSFAGAAPQDCAGFYGAGCSSGTGGFITPDFKVNMSAAYQSGLLSWRLVGRMIGGLDVYPGTAAFVKHVPPVWYVDTTFGVDLGEHVNLFAGIDNLANKQPPILGTTFVGDANVDVSLYDVQGRRYFAGVTLKL